MIVVVGSINMDLVVWTPRHPTPGETVLGSNYAAFPGGKGANQAIATVRSGSAVRMVGCLGEDAFGQTLLQGLQHDGIDTGWIKRVSGPSGVAFITINQAGQNAIVVAPGSNAALQPEDLYPTAFMGAKAALLQLEIPLPVVWKAAEMAKAQKTLVVLNAAPAQALSAEKLSLVDVLVVNEFEAGIMGGQTPQNPQQALEVAKALQRLVPTVVVTLGALGVVWVSPQDQGHLPVYPVHAVDTTSAGDAFVGMLTHQLAKGLALPQAVRWASACGALATTKVGAQPSIPNYAEVERLVGL